MARPGEDGGYYLKVEGASSPLGNLAEVIKRQAILGYFRSAGGEPLEEFAFGFFHMELRTSKWAVLRFFPRARMGREKIPEKDRLDSAIKYLSENGYRAIPFDLEGLIDNIGYCSGPSDYLKSLHEKA